MNAEERTKELKATFARPEVGRAKTKKTLEAQIQAIFGRVLSAEEVEATVRALIAEKILSVTEKGAVTYPA
jgi:hypothetical protein